MVHRSQAPVVVRLALALILSLVAAPALADQVPRTVFAEELGWVT